MTKRTWFRLSPSMPTSSFHCVFGMDVINGGSQKLWDRTVRLYS